jgi:hypothetical protein
MTRRRKLPLLQWGGYGGVDKLFRAAKAHPDGAHITRRKVELFLKRQSTHNLHVLPRKKFRRRKTISFGLHEYHQADLADMSAELVNQSNNMIQHWLVVICVWSRFLAVEPLHTKTAREVTDAYKRILERMNVRPKNLSTDHGAEFHNRIFKEFCKRAGINIFSTQNYDTKAALAERVIRTLKNKVYRYMTQSKTLRYIDKLQDFVKSYNSSYHRSIRMAPADVGPDTVIPSNISPPGQQKPPKLATGDKVRLSKPVNSLTHKGYKQQFTQEVFTVHKLLPTTPHTYTVKDTAGDSIVGSFYEAELQKQL